MFDDDALLAESGQTLAKVLASANWNEVFEDITIQDVDFWGDCPDEMFSLADVAEVLAIASRGDDTEDPDWCGWNGCGVFRLRDGRYLYAEGQTGYSGWDDYSSSRQLAAASSSMVLVLYALTENRRRGLLRNFVIETLWPVDMPRDTPVEVVSRRVAREYSVSFGRALQQAIEGLLDTDDCWD